MLRGHIKHRFYVTLQAYPFSSRTCFCIITFIVRRASFPRTPCISFENNGTLCPLCHWRLSHKFHSPFGFTFIISISYYFRIDVLLSYFLRLPIQGMRLLPAVSPADRLVDSVVYQSLWILGFADFNLAQLKGHKKAVRDFSWRPYEALHWHIFVICTVGNYEIWHYFTL